MATKKTAKTPAKKLSVKKGLKDLPVKGGSVVGGVKRYTAE
jgi:hypothetical protein